MKTLPLTVLATGRRMGVVMIIRGAMSMIVPRARSIMLMSRSRRYLFSVIDSSKEVAASGTCSRVRQ